MVAVFYDVLVVNGVFDLLAEFTELGGVRVGNSGSEDDYRIMSSSSVEKGGVGISVPVVASPTPANLIVDFRCIKAGG